MVIGWCELVDTTILPMEKKDSISQFVDRIMVRLDHDTNEHIITIKFKLPLVGDKLEYSDDTKTSKSYKFIKRETVDEVHTPVGKPRKDSRSHRKKSDGVTVESYSTTPSFHGNRLGQITGLIHVATTLHGDMVGQQLQRNRGQDRNQ